MKISKIVLTGGPCAGKTTGLNWIQTTFTKLGYTVLFVPETATELINGGINANVCGRFNFQLSLCSLQLEKERVFEQAAKCMDADKVLIVCDRGALDSKAYMSPEEYDSLLSTLNKNEVELRDNYDAVFHLVTAAKGAEEFYTTANNNARTETPEQAAALDDSLIAAWTGHPHLRVIENCADFETKMKHLIAEISSALGEPIPYEIERKFLIEYPDIAMLEAMPNCSKLQIIQTYLKSENGDEVRIRQRGSQGHYLFWKTTKRYISGMKRTEIEQRLSQAEYLSLLMEADTAKRQIRKNRYCLTYENHYFEIDVYPFWNDKAILEIELHSEDQEFPIPDFLHVIKEVTDDPQYKNSALANNQ